MISELLAAPARQAGSLQETAHRPWPLPGGSWIQGQTWENLLFAHWRVSVDDLRKHVPPQVEIDTHDGSAWLGITPFRLTGFRLRGMLPLPGVSSFLELNTMVPEGIELQDDAPVCHFSRRQDVVIWALEPAAGAS